MITQNVKGKRLNKYHAVCGVRRAGLIVIAAVFVLSVLSGCSLKRTVVNSTALFMEDVVDAFFAEGDIQFAEQAVPANLKLLDGLIRGSNYENDGLLLKGCKLYGMYGMGFMEDSETDSKLDKEKKKRAAYFYKRAKDYGMRILVLKPDFKAALDGSLDEFATTLQLYKKDDVEALFWTAFAWGSYINLNRNSTTDIADLPKVKAMIDRVIELDGSYFYGIPHIFMIVYYSMPPMFGGDPAKAKAAYETMKSISGGKFIIADFFMAKQYCVQAQDRELFDTLISNIENAPDDVIPEMLFTGVAKKKAAVLKAKADDLF